LFRWPNTVFSLTASFFDDSCLTASQDPLAREIIKRVDSSPYGSKTNKQAAGGGGGASKSRSAQNSESDHDVQPKIEGDQLDLRSTQYVIISIHITWLLTMPRCVGLAHRMNGRAMWLPY
jgi:hypothetical protein